MHRDAMKPPKHIDLGCHRYQLVMSRAAIDRASAQTGDSLLGQTDSKTCRIIVDPQQAASQVADTVMHELLHACCDLIGTTDQLTSDVEESVVRRLAPVLVDVLARNPVLVAWVQAQAGGS